MDLLEKSETTSICPYKGVASYWSIRTDNQIHKDLAWTYSDPLVDANQIKDYISFWKTDLYVNDKLKGKY